MSLTDVTIRWPESKGYYGDLDGKNDKFSVERLNASVPPFESISARESIPANDYKSRPAERLFMSETDRQAMNRGIDLAQLQTFISHASEHPEAIEFELGARSIDEGRPAHSTTEVGSYTFGGKEIDRDGREFTMQMGLWGELEEAVGFEDPADRMEPLEAALAALTGCLNATIGLHAVASGIEIEDIQTTVSTTFDPSVSFGLKDFDEVDSMFRDFRADVEIIAKDLDDDDRERLEGMLPLSATLNLLSRPWDIESDIRVTEIN